MSLTARRTCAAALATALSLAVLFPVLHGGTWFVRGLGAVLLVAAAGLATRSARLPALVQVVLALVLLASYLALLFVPTTLSHGLLPTGRTLPALGDLLTQGRTDIRRYAPPLTPRAGLLLLTTAGIGLVALLVDQLAVTADRVVVAGLPLLALFAVPSSVLPGGAGWLSFVVGASGWLVLLLEEAGDRRQRWGGPMRSTVPGSSPTVDDPGQGRVGRRLGAVALGLAVLLPGAVPGLDHRLVGNGGGGGGGADGPTQATTYNPITRLRQQLTLPDPQQLLVYTTDDPSPDYLRLTTLDTYTPEGWQSSQLAADPRSARVQRGIPAVDGEQPPTQDVRLRVAVDADHLDVHWLPLPYGPRRVQVAGGWLWDPGSSTAFSAARSTKGLAPYEVTAARPVPTADALRAAGVDYPESVRPFLEDPDVNPAVVDVASRVTARARTPYDRALAIQEYFTDGRNGFVYDTDPSQPLPGQDALVGFLEGKHGFCQQYATAMAVLLRLSGVPARVAVGFTHGELVSGKKGTYRVTTRDAHAWPEAYFPGTGWVRFEPTPGATAVPPPYTAEQAQNGNGGAQPSAAPQPSASAAPGGARFRDPDELLRNNDATRTATGTAARHHGSRTGLLLVLLLVAAAAPAVGTWARRRARAARRDPVAAWDQLRDDVRDAGRRWDPAATPRAVVLRVGEALPVEAAAALDRLARAVELSRYAPPGRQAEGDLVADGTAVRRALLAAAPRTVRWRAKAVTPSTLRWAAHTVSERVADALDAVDRAISWAGRPVRRVLRAG